MSKEKDPFDSPDMVELKGEVTGVTRLSGKAKFIFLLAGICFVSFIVFSIFTVDSVSGSVAGDQSNQKQDDLVATNGNSEFAKPDLVTKGASDGQAFFTTGKNNATTIASVGPSFDLNRGGNNAVTDPSLSTIKVPAVNVPVVPVTKGDVTPEALAAQRLEEQKQQKRDLAWQSELEVANIAETSSAPPSDGPEPTAKNDLYASALNQLGQAAVASKNIQEDPNKQIRKENFLREAEQGQFDQTYLKQIKQPPLSPYEIKAGWVIPAILECGVNSDLPGQVCARVRENVYDTKTGKYLLIPQGSRLIGTYDSQVAVGQERILLVWNRLIFPDGSSLTLQGMPGSNQAGYAGFDAEVDNHYFKLIGGALMMSMISAGVQLSQPQQSAGPNSVASTQQTMAAALGQQLGQVSGALIQKNLQIAPTLKQNPGYKFNVLVNRDIVFPGVYKN